MNRLFFSLSLVLGSVLLTPASLQAQAPESPEKPKYMVSEAKTSLNIKTDSTGELERGTVFTPTQQNGQWLWHPERKAWVRQSHLVPLDNAIELYTQQIEADPSNEAAYLNRALAQEYFGQNKSALADYIKAIELNPQSIEALKYRGKLYLRFEVYLDAIGDFTSLIELEPKNADHYLNRCDAWRGKGDIDNAIADVNAALRLDPRRATTYNKRGVIRGNNNEMDKALGDYTSAIQLDPAYAQAYSNRGFTYFQLKKYDEALADHTKAIELDPESYFDYKYRGDVLSAQGKHEEAAADFTRAVELRPDYSLALRCRGDCYRLLEQYDKAVEDYTQVIEINPKDSIAFNNRGFTYRLTNKTEEALADYNKVLELAPGDRTAIQNRGELFRLTREFDKAIADYNLLLQDDANNSGLYNVRGLSWHGKQLYEQAIVDFTKSLSINPKEPQVYINRAETYMAQGEFQAALTDYDKALELDQGTPAFFDGRAWLRAVCPDDAVRNGVKAVVDATKACELNGFRYYSYIDTLAAAYAATGEFEDAIKWELKAIEMAPNEQTKSIYNGRLALYRAGEPFLIARPGSADVPDVAPGAPIVDNDRPKMNKTPRPSAPGTPTNEAPPALTDDPAESEEPSTADVEAFAALVMRPEAILAWPGMQHLSKESLVASMQTSMGIDVNDINQVTVLAFPAKGLPPIAIFGLKEQTSYDEIDGTLVPKELREEELVGDVAFYRNGTKGLFVNGESGIVIYGDPRSLTHFLSGDRVPQDLNEKIAGSDKQYAMQLFLNSNRMQPLIEQNLKGEPPPAVAPLLELAKRVIWLDASLTLGEAIELTAVVETEGSESALAVQDYWSQLMGTAAQLLEAGTDQIIAGMPEDSGKDLIRIAADLLEQAEAQTDDNMVTVSITATGYDEVLAILAPAVLSGIAQGGSDTAPAEPDNADGAPPTVPASPSANVPVPDSPEGKPFTDSDNLDPASYEDVQAFAGITIWPDSWLEWRNGKHLPKDAILSSFKKTLGFEVKDVNKVTILLFGSKALPPLAIFGLKNGTSYEEVDGTMVPQAKRVPQKAGAATFYKSGSSGMYLEKTGIVMYGHPRSIAHMLSAGGDRIPAELRSRMEIEVKTSAMQVALVGDGLRELLDQIAPEDIHPALVPFAELAQELKSGSLTLNFGGEAIELVGAISGDDELAATVMQAGLERWKAETSLYLKENKEEITTSAMLGIGPELYRLADDLLYQFKPKKVGHIMSIALYASHYSGILEKLAPAIQHGIENEGAEDEPQRVDDELQGINDGPSEAEDVRREVDDAPEPLK